MSSQSHHNMSGIAKSQRQTDEIQLTERFSEQMAHLCMNEDYSDVTFLVENQRLPGHRVILAARSEYFRALLYGGLSESTQREIVLKIPLEAFKALLKYIYSGHMPLSQMSEENILDTLGLAHQYGLIDLELAISEYLRLYLAMNNVCAILDAARLYNLEKLTTVCLTFMDRNAADILQHESFRNLSQESLQELLSRDSFFVPEVQIFMAVAEWCKNNKDVDIESVVDMVRLPLMNLEHLLQVVRPTGIIDNGKLLDAIEEQTTCKNLPYRAALWPEVNVAKAEFASRTIQGECRAALLDGNTDYYDMEKGYTRHCISDTNDSCITVELGTICIVNHLKILLWDRDNRSYSYYVEVSVNQTHWDRVVDYTQYYCRSWQFLYFEARPIKYIRLVGTHNSVNKVFHVVALEAKYTTTTPKLFYDIVVPTSNVATIEMSALVVDGVSRTRNNLINGDFINYDWDSGYTCHQLNSGEIVVRLGQPYIISTMRLLLWDLDERTYSFYIEASVNQKDWQMVVDSRNEQAHSWQNFYFEPRPVVFIRIVGTGNTANEIFHLVHLECPSQDNAFLQHLEKDKTKVMIPEKEIVGEKSLKAAATSSSSTSAAELPSTSRTVLAGGAASTGTVAAAPSLPFRSSDVNGTNSNRNVCQGAANEAANVKEDVLVNLENPLAEDNAGVAAAAGEAALLDESF